MIFKSNLYIKTAFERDKMRKGFKSMQNWGEVAPAAISVSHRRKSSSFTKLEPIIEEGSEGSFEIGQKGVFFNALPLLLSGFMYILLFQEVVA